MDRLQSKPFLFSFHEEFKVLFKVQVKVAPVLGSSSGVELRSGAGSESANRLLSYCIIVYKSLMVMLIA